MVGANKRIKDIVQTILILAIVIALNFLGGIRFSRFDLTEEGLHSLSSSTIDLLENEVKDALFIKVYLQGEFPADVERYRKAIEEKLEEMAQYTDKQLRYEFIDPDEDAENASTLHAQLQDAGLSSKLVLSQESNSLSEIHFWPGCIIEYGQSKSTALQLIDGPRNVQPWQLNRGIDQLEYQFVQQFKKLTSNGKRNVGFLQGHGELSAIESSNARGSLQEFFNVSSVEIKDSTGKEKVYALNDYDALVIAHPTEPFSEKEKYVIDQFIMAGGKVAWLIDAVRVSEDSLFRTGIDNALPIELNLSDQLFSYGARINNNLVLDASCGPIYNPRTGTGSPWYFYVYGESRQGDAVSKGLNPVRFNYVSSVDPVGDERIKKRVLLESSEKTLIYKSPPGRIALSLLDPLQKPNFEGYNVKPHQPLALMLEGSFESFYRNSLDPIFRDNNDSQFKTVSEPSKMLVVGDGSFIRSRLRRKVDEEEFNPRTDVLSPDYEVFLDGPPTPMYSNIDFFLNAFEDLMDEGHLMELRRREFKYRPLSKGETESSARSFWQFINVVLPVMVLLIYGAVQFLLRKRKYASK